MNEFHHPLRVARNTRSCVSCTQYICFLEETRPKWMNVPACVCHCCFFQIQSEFNYKLWVSLFIREVSPKKFGVYLSKIFGRLSVANIQNAKMRPKTSMHNEKSKCEKEIYQMRYDTVLVLHIIDLVSEKFIQWLCSYVFQKQTPTIHSFVNSFAWVWKLIILTS